MSILYESVLVLNSSMIAIDICTVRKAVIDIFKNTAVLIKKGDRVLRSPSVSIPVPRIISFFGYHKIPKKRVRFSRLNVIYRDDQRCVYCSKRFKVSELTVDHVIPRSRWEAVMGKNVNYPFHCWENLVSACKRCNAAKGNRLLKELGWKLNRVPHEPVYMPYLIISQRKAERMQWLEYCKYNVKLIESI